MCYFYNSIIIISDEGDSNCGSPFKEDYAMTLNYKVISNEIQFLVHKKYSIENLCKCKACPFVMCASL
jgi:hypothetical protein